MHLIPDSRFIPQDMLPHERSEQMIAVATSKIENRESRIAYLPGPFVYRLGRQVFILVRGVRFPYGLPNATLRNCCGVAFFIAPKLSSDILPAEAGMRRTSGVAGWLWSL